MAWLDKYRTRSKYRSAARTLFAALDAAGVDAERIAVTKDGKMRVITSEQAAHDDLMEMIEETPGFKDALDAAMVADGQQPAEKTP